MKLVILCPRFPYPLEKGDKLRMYHQLKGLSQQHDICLVTLTSEPIPPDYRQKIEDIVTELHVYQVSKISRLHSMIRSVFSQLPLSVAYYYSGAIHKQMEALIARYNPDHVYYQLTRMCAYTIDASIPSTLDYMDAFGVGMARRALASKGILKYIYRLESRRMIAYERNVYQRFYASTIISHQDRKEIHVQNVEDIIVNPNGVDTDFFSTSYTGEKVYDIGFVGNMGYLPNIDAAKYLVKTILPLLRDDVKVLIAGARPTSEVKDLGSANVEISGWVEDIRTSYASCKVFVAPLWVGTGQQNKILEAMAMGIPCLTTSTVNAAIGAIDREHLWIADTVEEFVEAISFLLQNGEKRQEIAEAARAFVVANYSWANSIQTLNDIFSRSIKELN